MRQQLSETILPPEPGSLPYRPSQRYPQPKMRSLRDPWNRRPAPHRLPGRVVVAAIRSSLGHFRQIFRPRPKTPRVYRPLLQRGPAQAPIHDEGNRGPVSPSRNEVQSPPHLQVPSRSSERRPGQPLPHVLEDHWECGSSASLRVGQPRRVQLAQESGIAYAATPRLGGSPPAMPTVPAPTVFRRAGSPLSSIAAPIRRVLRPIDQHLQRDCARRSPGGQLSPFCQHLAADTDVGPEIPESGRLSTPRRV